MDEMNEMTMNEVTMDETVEVIPEEAVEVINDEKSGFYPEIVRAVRFVGGLAIAATAMKLYDLHKSTKVDKPKTKKKISFRLPVVITEEAVPEEVKTEEVVEQMEEIKKESEENK
jgi:hypothetical protein